LIINRTLYSLFLALIIGYFIPISGQQRVLSSSSVQVSINNEFQRKIISSKLISDINKVLSINKNKENEIAIEEKVGVVIYFDEFPSENQLNELEGLGIDCYTKTWIPPLENHPYGFILAKMPHDKLNETFSTTFVKKFGLITHTNNNNGTVVNLNGNPFTIQAPEGSYFIVVHHKNHLSVMSESAVYLTPEITIPAGPEVFRLDISNSSTNYGEILLDD